MTLILAIVFLSLTPLKNYTNYSLFYDVWVDKERVYLASNGGIVSFKDVNFSSPSGAEYVQFLCYSSFSGLTHNIVQSVSSRNDTVFAVPVNSGIFYHTPDMSGFRRYFVPYAGINRANKVRFYKDFLFVQLATSVLRIKLNGNLNPEDDAINVMILDSIGVMEIFGDTLYYSVKDTLFAQYIFSQNTSYQRHFSHNITCVFKDNMVLYVGTEKGYYRSDEDFDVKHLNTLIYSIWANADTVAVASSDGGYLIINNIQKRVMGQSYRAFFYKGNIYFNLISSPTNEFYNGGLWVLKGTEPIKLGSGIPTNYITTLDVLGHKVFCGTLDWRDKPSFLESKAFYIDVLEDSAFYIDSIGNSVEDAIRSIRAGNGSVFIGAYALNSSGLFVFTDAGVRHFTDFPSLLFTDFYIGNDTFLALWGDGIYKWTGGVSKLVYSVNYPSYITLDHDGNIWIGTEASGIIVLDRYGNVIKTINSTLPSPAITALLSLEDFVLAGTDAGLVIFYNPADMSVILNGKHIRSLASDKYGRIYALTDSALYYVNPVGKDVKLLLSSPPIVPIQAADWEVRNVLAVDRDLNLYIGGKEGILVVKLEAPVTQASTFLRVFPNPVKKGETMTICSDTDFKVLTIAGQKVASFSKGCNRLNTTSLAPGLYLIINKKGEKGKFVIKKQ